MTNRNKQLIALMKEGFEYNTLKNLSDTHIKLLHGKFIKEEDTEKKIETLNRLAKAAREAQNAINDVTSGELPEENENGWFEIEEKFESKSQQKFFFAKCKENGPKSKWCKMVKEFSDKTNFDTLPDKKETNEGTKCWKGYEKKGMKTMFGKRVPNCVKKETKEEKIRQIEESIVSLIMKSQGKMLTKKDILQEQPSIAPSTPTVKPGVKPERGSPYKPKHSPKPKAGTEVKPARPTVKPGVKPERGSPYKPKHRPKPKAGDEGNLPEFLKFSNLNIQFRDE